jgi:hypothetical protein
MSQEFDIHRELWDFCDENSKRVIHFYDEPEKDEELDPNEVMDLMDHLDKIEKENQEKTKKKAEVESKQESGSLDTSEEIFDHMCRKERK